MPTAAPVPAPGDNVIERVSAAQGGDAPAATQAYVPAGGDLAASLAAQLTCLQTRAQHDQDLDARAAALARQDATSLPSQGALHIAAADGHHLLLGPDMVAGPGVQHGRCGETLIFGVPPLAWLPEGTRFGIGVDQRGDGIIVVIVTR
jgi:hypothetical protein